MLRRRQSFNRGTRRVPSRQELLWFTLRPRRYELSGRQRVGLDARESTNPLSTLLFDRPLLALRATPVELFEPGQISVDDRLVRRCIPRAEARMALYVRELRRPPHGSFHIGRARDGIAFYVDGIADGERRDLWWGFCPIWLWWSWRA